MALETWSARAIASRPPLGGQQALQPLAGRTFRRARREAHREVVEGVVQVVGGGQRVAIHPEDGEAALVRHAPQPGEDVLGRERDPHDLEHAPLAVDEHLQARAGPEPAGLREALRDQRLQRAVRAAAIRGIEPTAAAQGQQVHARGMAQLVDADQPADDRVGHAGDRRAHDLLDGGLHVGHARHGAQRLLERVGGPLQVDEEIGEAAFDVVAVAGAGQGVDRRQAAHESRHAARDDERDRERLAPHQAQVAQQLAIERLHQLSSPAPHLCALPSTAWMRPPPSRITRSAMRAIAALCVITMTVVPSSRLMRAMTSSTSLPVS
jgi:hypothetical protein